MIQLYIKSIYDADTDAETTQWSWANNAYDTDAAHYWLRITVTGLIFQCEQWTPPRLNLNSPGI